MRCEVWGHSHTEKVCPYYGRARDSDQPVLQVGDIIPFILHSQSIKFCPSVGP